MKSSLRRFAVGAVLAATVAGSALGNPGSASAQTNSYVGNGSTLGQAYNAALAKANTDGYVQAQCQITYYDGHPGGIWEVLLSCTM